MAISQRLYCTSPAAIACRPPILVRSLISASRRPTCLACCMASTSAWGDGAGPNASELTIEDLRRFLTSLGSLYPQYMEKLWNADVGSLRELANASAATLHKAGVNSDLRIDNIKASAGVGTVHVKGPHRARILPGRAAAGWDRAAATSSVLCAGDLVNVGKDKLGSVLQCCRAVPNQAWRGQAHNYCGRKGCMDK